MSVQSESSIENTPFVLSGNSKIRESETILQDAGRTAVLAFGTVMGRNLSTAKWEPFSDEAAEDGTAIPQGIYVGDEITAAALVAGDVVNCPILVGGDCTVDRSQVVVENSKTLNTVIAAAANSPVRKTVQDWLADKGIFVETTEDIDELENT